MHVLRASGAALLLSAPFAFADPPVDPGPGFDPIPAVFCFRVTDVERFDASDGSPKNDFVFSFEVLNWTNLPAAGLYMAANNGLSLNQGDVPTIHGIGVDRDGRGGPAKQGNEIDASGAGITAGSGNFDDPAIHSGRGRGDIPSALNDWYGQEFDSDFALWGRTDTIGSGAAGTPIPNADLIGASEPGGILPASLVPGVPNSLDGLPNDPGNNLYGPDSAVDGGPEIAGGGYTLNGNGGFNSDVSPNGNVLDGFTMSITDWDVGEILSLNWVLLDDAGNTIGTAARGNAFGFGVVNLRRERNGRNLGGPVFLGNTGFQNRQTNTFYDTVWRIRNPAILSVELGAGITAPFIGPNRFDMPVNTNLIPPVPVPAAGFLYAFGVVSVGGCAAWRTRRARRTAAVA